MKKRVLQVLGGVGFGGAEAFIMNQFRNMQNEYTFDFAVQVHFDADRSYEKEINALGGNIYYTGLFRSSPIEYVKSIKRIIDEHGPYSAVHIHVNEQCGWVALGAKAAGVKSIIVHAHSSQYGQRNFWIRTGMLLANKVLVNSLADQIVACSFEAANMYFGYAGKKRAVILKNPIDIDRYYSAGTLEECRKKLGIQSPLVISHIGRFIDVKNHEFIIRICEKLNEKQVDFEMLLIGNGALRESVEKMAVQVGVSEKVRFLGERSDIPQILSVSNVMILPSKYEGLPTVVLEAQASGTPCIVSANINRNSDTGIGLVDFVGIEDSSAAEDWAERILNHKMKLRDINSIKAGFANHGISLESVSEILRSYYR